MLIEMKQEKGEVKGKSGGQRVIWYSFQYFSETQTSNKHPEKNTGIQ
jgi:hypothetical protein